VGICKHHNKELRMAGILIGKWSWRKLAKVMIEIFKCKNCKHEGVNNA
jgi:hypothetical protein